MYVHVALTVCQSNAINMTVNRLPRCPSVLTALILISLYFVLKLVENLKYTNIRLTANDKTERLKQEMPNAVLSCTKATPYLPGYVTDNREEGLIIYSELGKCGSGTLVSIITNECRRTGKYKTRYFWPIPDLNSPERRHKYIKDYILSQRKPFIFMGHLRFVDFTEFGYNQPVYIDWVRDPVERLISLYYYQRRTGNVNVTTVPGLHLTEEEMKRTLDESIQLWINKTGCNNVDDVPLCLRNRPHDGCKIDGIESIYPQVYSGRPYNRSREVLINMAKSNIERYYAFIGVNEYYVDSIKGLEKVLKFKDRLSLTYQTMYYVNVGHNKFRPSDKTIALLKTLLANDYTIYEFIRQRLYVHLKCLGIYE